MIALLSELSARHLAKAPWRSAAALLAGALGVVLSLSIAASSARAVEEFEQLVRRSAGRTDLSIEAPGLGLLRNSVESVLQIAGVAHASARVELPVQVTDFGESLLLIGVDYPDNVHSASFEMHGGEPWPARAASHEQNAIFLSEEFASRHGLNVGSAVHLQTETGPKEFWIRGLLSDSGPAAAFHGQFATLFLDSLQSEFGPGRFIDRIDVGLVPGADRFTVEKSLRELLGTGVSIGAAGGRGTWLRDLFEPLRGSLRLAGLLEILAVFAALLAVRLGGIEPREGTPAPRRSSAADRTPVAVLRLAVLGGALSLAAWLPVLRGARWGVVIGVSLALTGAALLTPALVVALCRTFARAAGILAVSPRSAHSAAARTLSRGTLSLFAAVVAVGASVCASASLKSFERSSIRWIDSAGLEDLTVTRGSPLFEQRQAVYAGSVAEAVERVPGASAVQRYRRFEQRVDEGTIGIIVTDTDVLIDRAAQQGKSWPLLRGAPLKRGELEGGPEILLSAGAARSLGKDAGDSVTIRAPRGDVPFVVRGITEGDPASVTGFVDRRHLRTYWGDDTVDRIGVYVAPGQAPERVAAAIRAALGTDGSSFVTDTSSLRSGLTESLRPLVGEARSHERAILGLSLLAIAVAVAAPRVRSRGQPGGANVAPRRRIEAELLTGAAVGVCVLVAGCALGVLLRELLGIARVPSSAWRFDFSVPWDAVARAGAPVTVLFALAGAASPAIFSKIEPLAYSDTEKRRGSGTKPPSQPYAPEP